MNETLLQVRVPTEDIRKLRAIAALSGESVKTIVCALIKDYLEMMDQLEKEGEGK